jgi:hypothetical protein
MHHNAATTNASGTMTSRITVPLFRTLTRAAVAVLGAGLLMAAPMAFAQTPAQQASRAASSSSVPTTRILAIGTLTKKANSAAVGAVLPAEVRQTVQLYLDGTLDQWFVKQDQSGVVFILNVTDPAEAHALLDKLPLGQAGLMEFQLIPLGPLKPLSVLLAPNS